MREVYNRPLEEDSENAKNSPGDSNKWPNFYKHLPLFQKNPVVEECKKD